MYTLAGGCPDDDAHDSHNAYLVTESSCDTDAVQAELDTAQADLDTCNSDLSASESEFDSFKNELSDVSITVSDSAWSYQYVHDGHCSSGWLYNVYTVDTPSCAQECYDNADCGYFAWSPDT